MFIVIGLVIFVVAVVVGVAGVLVNGGGAHALTNGFAVFGYHVTGSTGDLFLSGIVVGAVGLGGLALLLTGARRTARRGTTARRELEQSRGQTAAVSQDLDNLVHAQRREVAPDTVPAQPADHTDHPAGNGSAHGWLRNFGHRPTDRAMSTPSGSEPD